MNTQYESGGKVIPFNRRSSSARNQPETAYERRREREKTGDLALESLRAWRRSLPHNDRVQMAKNMEALLQEHGIKPRHLAKHNVSYYPDDAALRRDLSRMRLESTVRSTRKRLVARPAAWLQVLTYVSKHLMEKSNSPSSIEWLAEKLTKKTRFHPAYRVSSTDDKLNLVIHEVANQVARRSNLIEAYRRLATARVEYLQQHGAELVGGEASSLADNYPDLSRCAADDFEVIERHASFFEKPYSKYMEEDWELLRALSSATDYEDYLYEKLLYIKEEIGAYHRMFDPRTTLAHPTDGALLWEDICYFPRFFVGFLVGRRSEQPNDSRVVSLETLKLYSAFGLSATGGPLVRPDDPDKSRHCLGESVVGDQSPGVEDLHAGSCYLVLYPNSQCSRIVPYVFYFEEEGSRAYPYDDEPVDDYLFAPVVDVERPLLGRTIAERVEEELETFEASFIETSKYVQDHPYLEWSRGRGKRVEKYLDSLLD